MKKVIYILIALCLTVCFCSCNKGDENVNKDVSSAISFVDDDGININMDKPGERIISLYSAHTENIYYLGAESKLIGAYKTCTYPPDAAFLERFDYNGDPEAIIAANPDLVIIRPFVRKKAPDYVKAIENAGITVVSLYPDKFEEFDDYINKLAMITGTTEKAQPLLNNFHKELDDIKNTTALISNIQTIFFESTETNIRTITPDSMAGIAIEYAGGNNIAKDTKPIEKGSSIAEFGEEKVLMNADNIDVYVSQRGSMNSGASEQGISERAGFDTIKAIKAGRFYTINEKIISSPTFRYVKGVRELARYLYPDVMDDITPYQNNSTATRSDFANILFRYLHIPIFVPSSSSYYQTEQKGHTFGMFDDVKWQDEDFDSIEACVESGYIEGFKENDKEYFNPSEMVSRDELAQAIFVIGDFSSKDANTYISDIDKSKHQRIVQILVDNGIFELNNGKFEPERQVTNNEILKALEYVK